MKIPLTIEQEHAAQRECISSCQMQPSTNTATYDSFESFISFKLMAVLCPNATDFCLRVTCTAFIS